MTKSRNNRNRSGSVNNRVVSIPFREYALRISQTTSGIGGLTTTGVGSASLTAASGFPIDPWYIGGRFLYISSVFLEYRIVSLRVRYIPSQTSSSGVEEIVTGGTTTPSYAVRGFAWQYFDDPALVLTTYTAILSSGGVSSNTTRPCSLGPFKGGGLARWRYTSTTISSPTTIDLRMAAPGQLRFAFFNASTTAAESFGDVEISFVAHFRGPVSYSPPIGRLLKSQSSPQLQVEVKKKEDPENDNGLLI